MKVKFIGNVDTVALEKNKEYDIKNIRLRIFGSSGSTDANVGRTVCIKK